MAHFRLYVFTIASTLSIATAGQAAPAIAVTPAGLRASGITAGSDAIWFGMTIDTFSMARRLERHAVVARDIDRDGVVLYELPKISRFTLMFVVDAATGGHAVFRGEGVDAIELDLRGNAWRAELRHFDIRADDLEILLVRPGEGAWTTSAMEGDENDGDGRRDAKFRLKIGEMTPLGSAPGKPGGGVRRGDVLVAFDPHTFQFVVRPARD